MRGWNLKRWIALALGIGIALGAGYLRLRSAVPPPRPAESLSAASRAQLDDVLRKAGAGEPQR